MIACPGGDSYGFFPKGSLEELCKESPDAKVKGGCAVIRQVYIASVLVVCAVSMQSSLHALKWGSVHGMG